MPAGILTTNDAWGQRFIAGFRRIPGPNKHKKKILRSFVIYVLARLAGSRPISRSVYAMNSWTGELFGLANQ